MKSFERLRKSLKYLVYSNKDAVFFLIIFVSLNILFFSFFYFFEEFFDFLKNWTAELTVAISNFFGMEAKVSGTSILLKNITFEIVQECTGIFAFMIYLSCVLAYPTNWKNRGIGIAIGFPFIFAVNLLRMVFLVYVGNFHASVFDYVHSYLWQGTFIVFVVLIWLLWIEKVVK